MTATDDEYSQYQSGSEKLGQRRGGKLSLGGVVLGADHFIVGHAAVHRLGPCSKIGDGLFQIAEGFIRGTPLGDHAGEDAVALGNRLPMPLQGRLMLLL